MTSSSRLTKLLSRGHSREKWQNSSMNGIWKSLSKRMQMKLQNRLLKETEKEANRLFEELSMEQIVGANYIPLEDLEDGLVVGIYEDKYM